MINEEFVFGVQERKYHTIDEISTYKKYEQIFIEESDHLKKEILRENIKFWNNVSKGWVLVFQVEPKRKEDAGGGLKPLGKYPVEDAIKKFG